MIIIIFIIIIIKNGSIWSLDQIYIAFGWWWHILSLSIQTSLLNWITGDIHYLEKFVNERQHSQTNAHNLCPDAHSYRVHRQQLDKYLLKWLTDSQIYCRSSFCCSIFTSIDAKYTSMIFKAHKRPGNKSIIVECDFSPPQLRSLVRIRNVEKLYSKAFRDDNVLHLSLDTQRERNCCRWPKEIAYKWYCWYCYYNEIHVMNTYTI